MVPVAVADQKVGSPAFLTDRVLIKSSTQKCSKIHQCLFFGWVSFYLNNNLLTAFCIKRFIFLDG